MNYFTNNKQRNEATKEAIDLQIKQENDLLNANQEVVNFRNGQVDELKELYQEKMEEMYNASVEAEKALADEHDALAIELNGVIDEVKLQKEQGTQQRLAVYLACKESLEANKALDIARLAALGKKGLAKHTLKQLIHKIVEFYEEKITLLDQIDAKWGEQIDNAYREGINEINKHWDQFCGYRSDCENKLYFFYRKKVDELNALSAEEVQKLDFNANAALEAITAQYTKNSDSIKESLYEHTKALRRQAKYRRINAGIVIGSLVALHATGGLAALAGKGVTPILKSKMLANSVNGLLFTSGCGAIKNLVDGKDIAGIYFEGRVPLGRDSDLYSRFEPPTTPLTYNNPPTSASLDQLRSSVFGNANRLSYAEQHQLLAIFGLQPPRLNIPRQPTFTPLGSGLGAPMQRGSGVNLVSSHDANMEDIRRRIYGPVRSSRAVSAEREWGLSTRSLGFAQNPVQFQVFLRVATGPQLSFNNLAFSSRPNNQYAIMPSRPAKPSLGERILNFFIPVAHASDIPLDTFRTEQHTSAMPALEDVRSKRTEYSYERDFVRDYMITFKNGAKVGLKADAYVKVYESHGEDEKGNYSMHAFADGRAQIQLLEHNSHYSFGRINSSIDLFNGRFKFKIDGEFGEEGIFSDSCGNVSGKIFHIKYTFEGNKKCVFSLCLDPEAHFDGHLLDVSRDGYKVNVSRGGINFKVQPNFSRDTNAEHTTEERIVRSVELFFSNFHKVMLDNFARTEDYDAIASNPLITEKRKQEVVYPMWHRAYM